tara:strand:- start:670 stop:1107 length:438 start_codon:yes stop_codon:yes gene_type:complete
MIKKSKYTLNSKKTKKGGAYNYYEFMDIPMSVRRMIISNPYKNTKLMNAYHQQKAVLEYYYRERDRLTNILDNTSMIFSFRSYLQERNKLHRINDKISRIENRLIQTQERINLLRDLRNDEIVYQPSTQGGKLKTKSKKKKYKNN